MSDLSDLSDSGSEFQPLEGTLTNLLEQTSLKWIFVGGKGGVGKTTSSCSLAVQLAKVRKSVLLISTDPAHNLSDAFAQKINRQPTLIEGFDNLYAMEVDPESSTREMFASGESNVLQDFMVSVLTSLPGIDEIMSLHEVAKIAESKNYSVVVFDTAPTGHTLRFLQLPSTINTILEKLTSMRSHLNSIMNTMPTGLPSGAEEKVFEKMENIQTIIKNISQQLVNPDLATFVCVCISEFLSLYETERMIQELMSQKIDTHNIIVNQLLYPSNDSSCEHCRIRYKMQQKYLEQIYDLYEDFHVVTLPLLTSEVRGPKALKEFSEYLIHPYQPPNAQE